MDSTTKSFVRISIFLSLVVFTAGQTSVMPSDGTNKPDTSYAMTTPWWNMGTGNMSTWQIVAIVIPLVIGGLSLIATLICCCCCRGSVGPHGGYQRNGYCCDNSAGCCGPSDCYCGGCCAQEPHAGVYGEPQIRMQQPQCGCEYLGKPCSCRGAPAPLRSVAGPVMMAPRYTSSAQVMPGQMYSRY